MTEDDKISQMLSDSGDYYNQKNWLQLRGRSAYAGQRVPPGYKCNRCGKTGHFIYDCPEGKSRMGFGFSMEFLVEIRILTLQFQVQIPKSTINFDKAKSPNCSPYLGILESPRYSFPQNHVKYSKKSYQNFSIFIFPSKIVAIDT